MATRALAIEPKNITTTEPLSESIQPDLAETSDQQGIAALAYCLWQDRGCPFGSSEQDWFEAERQLESRNPLGRHLVPDAG